MDLQKDIFSSINIMVNYNKKPVIKRKKRRVFRKKTFKPSFKSKVLKIVNKGREIKGHYNVVQANESNNPSRSVVPVGNQMWCIPTKEDDLNTTRTSWNSIPQGTAANNREGNQVNPMSFNFKGYLYTYTTNPDAIEDYVKVRVIWGFVNQDTTPLIDAGDLFKRGSNDGAIYSDQRALYQKLNWTNFRPFYDRVFTLSSLGTASIRGTNMINVSHKFGKEAKLTFASSNIQEPNKNAIQCMLIARTFNKGGTSALAVKLIGNGEYNYTDS